MSLESKMLAMKQLCFMSSLATGNRYLARASNYHGQKPVLVLALEYQESRLKTLTHALFTQRLR